MNIELKNLTRIAQGGQAEIFAFDSNKVLRVLRNPNDEELLKNEMSIMKILKDSEIDVPEIFDFVFIDNRPALIMQKIKGISMMEALKRNPYKIDNIAKTLAQLHYKIGKMPADKNLLTIKQTTKSHIQKSVLSEPLKEFVYTLINELPDEYYICHGDFHPGNILIEADRFYVIDWFGVTSGDPLSDVAHSYLIMRNVPKVPGISNFN